MNGRAAEAGLVRLAGAWARDLAYGQPPHWYWYPPDPVRLFTTWFDSVPVLQRLARFAAAHPDCADAAAIPQIVDALVSGAPMPWDLIAELEECVGCAR
jgi:hypothetical protein